MRRLPVFFVVDVSESMVGEGITQLEEAFQTIVGTLRKDPYALETAYVSVIAFAGKAHTIIPLVELFNFHPPELPVGGGTNLGVALNLLMDDIDQNVQKGTPQAKGDWKPIVFLITDGHPTDDLGPAISRWNNSYRDKATLVAVSVGGQADHSALQQLTEHVIVFYDSAPDAFEKFAQWISVSIQAQSRSVNEGLSEEIQLTEDEMFARWDDTMSVPNTRFDDRFVVFVGRCQRNKLPYVAKYERHNNQIETDDPFLAEELRKRPFVFSTVVPVKNSYFDFTEEGTTSLSINTSQLLGGPGCPHCGAEFGLAMCSCGQVHCIDGEGEAICPWCEDVTVYSSGGDGEGSDFEITRGRG
jgi:uncharacterized protein YegL